MARTVRLHRWQSPELYEAAQKHSRYYHESNVTEQTNQMWIEHLTQAKATAEKREENLTIIFLERKRAAALAEKCLQLIDPEVPPKTARSYLGRVFLHLTTLYEKAGGKKSIPTNLDEVADKFYQLITEELAEAKQGGNSTALRIAELAYQRHTDFMNWIDAETKIFRLNERERMLRRVASILEEKPSEPVGGSAYEAFVEEAPTPPEEKEVYAPKPPQQKTREELELEEKRKLGTDAFYEGPAIWRHERSDDKAAEDAEQK